MNRMILSVGVALFCSSAMAQQTTCQLVYNVMTCNTAQQALPPPTYQQWQERAQAIREQRQVLQQEEDNDVDAEELKLIENELPNATPERRRELLITIASINPEMAIQYQKLLTLMDEQHRATSRQHSH